MPKKTYRRRYRKKNTLTKRVTKLEQNLNAEEKKFDDTQGSASFTSSGSIFSLGTVDQGNGVNQRIGNKIKLTGLNVRVRVYASTSSAAETFRMIIFKDNQDRGVAPLITDLLENNQVESPLKQSNMGRFRILADRTLCLRDNTQASMIIMNKKLNSIMRYEGVNLTDVVKGGIYVAYIGTQAVHFGTMLYWFRVWYSDA